MIGDLTDLFSRLANDNTNILYMHYLSLQPHQAVLLAFSALRPLRTLCSESHFLLSVANLLTTEEKNKILFIILTKLLSDHEVR